MNTLDKEDRQMQVEDVKTDVAHLEQGNDAKRDNVVTQAMEAEAADIQMSFREAVRTHKAAVFWSVMVSMCVVSCLTTGHLYRYTDEEAVLTSR